MNIFEQGWGLTWKILNIKTKVEVTDIDKYLNLLHFCIEFFYSSKFKFELKIFLSLIKVKILVAKISFWKGDHYAHLQNNEIKFL
jgi:hypothetical protein